MGEPNKDRAMSTTPDVAGQAAEQAWKEFAGSSSEILGIEPLKERDKTRVYRLELGGGTRKTVIAKWKPQRDDRESEIYVHVLPLAGLAAPEVYGELAQQGEGFWLFMEDLGDEQPSLTRLEDRRLAAHWLAALHQCSVPIALRNRDRDSTSYFRVTRSLRQTICDNLYQPWVTETSRATLSRILRTLEYLERNWARLDAVCGLAPQTIVHGDLVRKNVRIRKSKANIRELVVLDWEMAGVGVPSIDFSLPTDLTHYVESMQFAWPGVSLATVKQLARVGAVFRSLAALEWAAEYLPHEWSHWVGFEDAERWLQDALRHAETTDWV